ADPRRTVAALVDVPALGLASVRPVPSSGVSPETPAEGEGDVLDNGLLRAQVHADGTLGLRTASGIVVEGIGRIVDGGDLGDTYNYAPPAADRLVGDPLSVDVRPVWSGALVAACDIVRTYRWPASGDLERDARSEGEEDVTVATRAELRAGEPFLRLRVTFDNRCEDHRVRLHLALPRRADTSFAEGQFAITERGTTAEGGFGERPVPTFPASGFVAAGGLAVLLEHVTEYEVIGGGRELALTLLRSVGHLSRDRNPYRDQPAGPQLPTPRAQCRGERSAGFAIMPYAGERPGSGVLRAAEAYRHDLLTAVGYGPAAAAAPPSRAGVEIAGDGVAMTSLRARDGWIETRVVALRDEPVTAVLRGPFIEAVRTDLRGRPGAALAVPAGTAALGLRPWEMATVRLRTAASGGGRRHRAEDDPAGGREGSGRARRPAALPGPRRGRRQRRAHDARVVHQPRGDDLRPHPLDQREEVLRPLAHPAAHDDQRGGEQTLQARHVHAEPLGPLVPAELLHLAGLRRRAQLGVGPVDLDVPELGVGHEDAVGEQRAADARPERQHQHGAAVPAAAAEPHLRDAGRVRVVEERDLAS